MKLTLKRKFFKEKYTIGILTVNGKYMCDTLEDYNRDHTKNGRLDEPKIYGKTAIPYGKYAVTMTFSPKFQRKLPLLINVPGFEFIRIHSGNNESHTSGCILLGENRKKGQVINSKFWVNSLCSQLEAALSRKEKIEIEIT